MKPISTQAHGVLDYLTAGLLYALPRRMGWKPQTTQMLTVAAAGTVAYSLLTRYEMGFFRVLPMRGHLALDMANGASLAAAPFLFLDEDPPVAAALVALGLFEIVVPSLTEPESPLE